VREFFKHIKFVWRYASGQKLRLFFYLFSGIFNIGFSVVSPLIGAQMVLNLTNNKIDQFFMTGLIILGINIVTDTIVTIRSIMYQKIVKNLFVNIQLSVGSEILKLNNKTLEEKGSGVFIQRISGDTKNISSIFTDINTYLNRIITNLGFLVTMFVISKIYFLFAMVAFLIRILIERIRINTYNEKNKVFKKHYDELTGFTGEIVRGAEDIKMLNGETSFITELRNRFSSLNNESYNMEKTNIIYNHIRFMWSDIAMFFRIFLVGILIKKNLLTIPYGLVLYNMGATYNTLANNITNLHERIVNFNLSASRVFDIFNNKEFEKEIFGNKHIDKVNGDFEFKDVIFKYEKTKVLNNLSFKVNANETVAFVGKSGAGKTTIFNLLCKMYDNYKGTITIDGIDIKELDRESIRGNITIVSQNPYIFNMSIKDNLRLVKQDLTDKEMRNACKMACLDDYIMGLPDKYNTIVGEGGVTLSGGQKQRLAIARAFVQKTEIILFDEATSALDNETQTQIQKAIDNLQKDYTILIIAHRLSTIKNADRILFIDDGKVIAEGKHEQLLKKCKEYKHLYENEITKIDKK